MKYTKQERLDIGKRVYDGEINKYQVATEYDISKQTARNYMRQYRFANELGFVHFMLGVIKKGRA